MSDSFEPANFTARLWAGAVDFGVAILIWLLLSLVDFPLFGIFLCSAYLLLRDGLDGQSLGKKWQKLAAVNLETNRPCSWMDSIMRNLFVFLPLVGPLWALVEGYYAMQDGEYRRIGDRFANTMVVGLPGTEVAAPPHTEAASSSEESHV